MCGVLGLLCFVFLFKFVLECCGFCFVVKLELIIVELGWFVFLDLVCDLKIMFFEGVICKVEVLRIDFLL